MRSLHRGFGLAAILAAAVGLSGCTQDNEARSGIDIGGGSAPAAASTREAYNQSAQQQQQNASGPQGYPGAK